MSRSEPSTVVVGTDPADVDVRGSIVVVPGLGAGRRVARLGGTPVVAHPARLPVAAASAAVGSLVAYVRIPAAFTAAYTFAPNSLRDPATSSMGQQMNSGHPWALRSASKTRKEVVIRS